MIENNFLATFMTFFLALIWLRINDFAAGRGWISSRLSRKIIHIGTGPIFVLCWIFFDNDPINRWLAACVPLLFSVQFLLIGLGVVQDEESVQAMSRSGDRREILRGPLYYGIVFVLITVIFWRDHPAGVAALMILCGGDGLADLVGRKYPIAKIPWNKEKSLGGSSAVLLGGFILSAIILAIYQQSGIFALVLPQDLTKLLVVALGATLIETLPIKESDNLTVSITAAIIGYLVL
jgi:phytol kinase